jgi:ABC-2 type transport system ATP-binding protein
VRKLLQQLNREVFILDTAEVLEAMPVVDGYVFRQLDEHSLEVEIEKGQALNPVFSALSEQRIQVVSMRNKANRLEELFVSLVSNHRREGEGVQ